MLTTIAVPAALAVPPGWDAHPSLPDSLGEPAFVDVDLNGTADLAYAGDRQGNLYRVDIGAAEPSAWHAVVLFQAFYDNGVATRQPIVRRPFVNAHPRESGFLVVFATGDDAQDPVGADVQSIYAIWDRGEPHPATARPGSKQRRLIEREVVNVVAALNGTLDWRRIVTGGPVQYAPDAPGRSGVYGWYIDLDMPRAERTLNGALNPDSCGAAPPAPQYPGERAAGRFIARGDTLIVATTFPPGARSCDGAPAGSILAIDVATGGSPRRQVFDVNGDGHVDSHDLVAYQGTIHVSGLLLRHRGAYGNLGDPALIAQPDGTGELIVGDGDGRVTVSVDALGTLRTGRMSWRELTDQSP